jgi:hypothetical protein
VEENHKSLHQEEGVIVVQAIFDDVFESMEDTTPPRRNDTLLGGMRVTRSTSMRFIKPQGSTEESSVPPR